MCSSTTAAFAHGFSANQPSPGLRGNILTPRKMDAHPYHGLSNLPS